MKNKHKRIITIMALCLVIVTMLAVGGCDKTENLPKRYTVNFVGEGVGIKPQFITRGNYVTAPENPERAGYGFGGWFTDNGTFANEWDFKTDVVTQNTTLYAKWEENTVRNYPIEIPFTEYSLEGTSCQWTNLNYDDDDKLIVINSDEELKSYIDCSDANYPKIDFSKHILLLAHGIAPASVANVSCSSLLQFSEQSYEMKVEIVVGHAAVLSNWQVSIIVDKVVNDSSIELISTIKQYEL